MKNIILALMAVIVITSCKKSDSTTISIVGNWQSTKSEVKEYRNNVLIDTSSSNYPYLFKEFDSNGSYRFKNDDPDEQMIGQWRNGTYTINWSTSTITTTNSLGTSTRTIKSLTQNELILEDTETYISNSAQMKDVYTETYKRIK